jgi:hypothetical protein
MKNLNSQANRDREASSVTNRVALLNVARALTSASISRCRSRQLHRWHNTIVFTGVGLDVLAGYIRITAEVQDQAAFDLADQVSSVAEWFLQFEDVWCLTVSDPSPYPLARCYEHDGIVPAWSQAYDLPRLQFILRSEGPIHTGETSDSDDQLYQAFTTVAGVAKRDSVWPPSAAAGSIRRHLQILHLPPPPPSSGRTSWSTHSACGIHDSGPDQCSPLPPPGGTSSMVPALLLGAERLPTGSVFATRPHRPGVSSDGNGGCFLGFEDGGPDQCAP